MGQVGQEEGELCDGARPPADQAQRKDASCRCVVVLPLALWPHGRRPVRHRPLHCRPDHRRITLAAPAQLALASSVTLYAYAHGGATSPASCPKTNKRAQQCSLGEALAKAAAGDDIAMATSGRTGNYVGNWDLDTAGTAATAPISIKPAPGVTGPVLNGNNGQSAGCGTKACDGPVLTVGVKVHLNLDGLTIRDANNTAGGLGGAVENIHGGTVPSRTQRFSITTPTPTAALSTTPTPVAPALSSWWIPRSPPIQPSTATGAPSPMGT